MQGGWYNRLNNIPIRSKNRLLNRFLFKNLANKYHFWRRAIDFFGNHVIITMSHNCINSTYRETILGKRCFSLFLVPIDRIEQLCDNNERFTFSVCLLGDTLFYYTCLSYNNLQSSSSLILM